MRRVRAPAARAARRAACSYAAAAQQVLPSTAAPRVARCSRAPAPAAAARLTRHETCNAAREANFKALYANMMTLWKSGEYELLGAPEMDDAAGGAGAGGAGAAGGE